jgi:4-amino-4-deoxy-L-arabinose transferase-like glycosyltransferase
MALAGCAGLALLCRLPFVTVPLTQDEGGYAYVARLWAAGTRLYDGAWMDRPQGLALLFRLLVSVAPSTMGLRLWGAAYAAASALLLAYVGWRLYGTASALGAAALYAIFSSEPQIEGFTVNGELLATLPTVAAVAALLRAQRAARGGSWLYLAGFCAGSALLIKQSALDGAVIVLLFALLDRPTAWRARMSRFALVAAGLATAVALSAIHGAVTGWHNYLDAVLLDNLRYHSTEASSDSLALALRGMQRFWAGNAFLLVAALPGVLALLRERSSIRRLPLAWLAAAALGVTLGGLYNRHYFVQLLPPLCLLAAEGLVRIVRLARHAPAAGLLLVIPSAVLGMAAQTDAPYYVGNTQAEVAHHLYFWPEYRYQNALVAAIGRHVPPGTPFFVAFAAPELHYLADRPSVTRYLWRRPLGELPGAYEAVLHEVDRAVGGPVCVVVVQDVTQPPGDQQMRAAILRHYRRVWSRPGLSIYCRPHGP